MTKDELRYARDRLLAASEPVSSYSTNVSRSCTRRERKDYDMSKLTKRVCTKCHRSLFMEEDFYKSSNSPDGYFRHCKDCDHDRQMGRVGRKKKSGQGHEEKAPTVKQTWLQYLIKKDMGLFDECTEVRVHFHWRFWAPVDCVSGKVYFGRYVEHSTDWRGRDYFGEAP